MIQGASRARCRQVEEDQALPTKVYLVHKSSEIQHWANQVMPGAQWHEWHRPESRRLTLPELVAGRLSGALSFYPRDQISTKALRHHAQLSQVGHVSRKVLTAAVALFLQWSPTWDREGRSLVRRG